MRFAMTVVMSILLSHSGDDLTGIVRVRGSVRTVPAVHVRLERLGFTVQETVAFDGRFHFGNLAPGRYTIVVDAPGFQRLETSLEMPGDSLPQIELRPLKDAAIGKAETRSVAQYQIPASAMKEFNKGHFGKAIRILTNAMEKNPEHQADFHMLLAKAYLKEGKEELTYRELDLYVTESPPSSLRDRLQKILEAYKAR